jgi:hypothetical protein
MKAINFKLKNENDHRPEKLLLVEVSIDNTSFEFLVDTGGATTLMQRNEFTESYSVKSSSESGGAFSNVKYEKILIEKLVFLGTFEDVLIERESIKGQIPYNILGLDILGNFSLYFDFKNNVINAEDILEGKNKNELILSKVKHPHMSVSLESVKGTVLWDSGASITIVGKHFINKYPFLFEQVGSTTGMDSNAYIQETNLLVMNEMNIDGRKFSKVVVAEVDMGFINNNSSINVDMILGYPTISQYNWLIDLKNGFYRIDELV